jgi:tetratricopeptide (TPR) repeat protein
MMGLIRVAIVCLAVGLSLAAPADADEAEFAATCERATVAALEAVSHNPKAATLFPTTCLDVVQKHRQEFEAAFEGARRVLRENVADPNLRANLGMLFFLRDKARGEELGGVERSADHFLAALAANPRDPATLAYLGSYVFLDAYRGRLTAAQLHTLEAGLRRAMAPDNHLARRVLVRLLIGDPGRLDEVTAEAEYLAAHDPNAAESWALLASVRLLQKRTKDALQAFNRALSLRPAKREEGAILLGIAACHLAQNELQAADKALAAAKSLPLWSKDLEAAAREHSLESPENFGWSLGKGLIASGQTGRALPLIGMAGLEWMASHEAFRQYEAGAEFFVRKDYDSAHAAFLKAVQLVPLEPYYIWALAVCSFESGHRYREAIWAYEKLATIRPFSQPVDYYELGLARAVTGDYAGARTVFDEGARKFPDNAALRAWRVVVTYGIGGWDEATGVWREHHPGSNTYADRGERFNLLYDGLRTIAARAERQGGRYVTFGHLSLLYRLVSESARQGIYNDDGKRWVREELKRMRTKLVELYRDLPLKPTVSEEALRLASEGQAYVDAGDTQKAMERYRLAVELAPCWPEGIYNLAVAARAGGPWLPGAIEEMKIYLSVVPEGQNTAKERMMLASWENNLQRALAAGGEIVEIPGGSSGEALAELYGADNGGAIPSHGPVRPWGPQ